MKTIAIDCRFGNTNSGIGRYTRELVPSLLNGENEMKFVLLVLSQDEKWLRTLKGNFSVLETGTAHYSWKEQTQLPKLLKELKADLLFSPHFNVPFFCPLPFVITIHDLILHWYPNQAPFFKRFAYKVLMSRAVRKAKKIIAVSEFTKKELRFAYGKRTEHKTVVIPEGVSPKFNPQPEDVKLKVQDIYGLKKPYFLYVGNAKEHKNVQTLIDAFEELNEDDKELVLVSSGKELNRLDIKDGVRIIEKVTDEDLPALYSAATAFVTASKYEGFCLPVAEAQACGCPVIASNKGAIPEVADDNAILIAPTAKAFSDALRNPPKRKMTVNTLDWKSAASKTLSVLHSALKEYT